MRRSLKVRLALAAMMVGAVTVAALPASASTGTLVLIGTGTISPGLTQDGDPAETFVFGAIGVLVSTDGVLLNVSCTITGNDTIGSWMQSSGSFTGSCWLPGGPTSISGTYTRTAALLTMAGTSTDGLFTGSFTAVCGWAPTNIDGNTEQITAFALACPLLQP